MFDVRYMIGGKVIIKAGNGKVLREIKLEKSIIHKVIVKEINGIEEVSHGIRKYGSKAFIN